MPILVIILGRLLFVRFVVILLLAINMDIHLVVLMIIVNLLVNCIVLKVHRRTPLFVSQ